MYQQQRCKLADCSAAQLKRGRIKVERLEKSAAKFGRFCTENSERDKTSLKFIFLLLKVVTNEKGEAVGEVVTIIC